MKNIIVMWLGVMALAAAPAGLWAQEGPEGSDMEEIEITEGGPGPAHAGMGMQRKGPGAKKGIKEMRWIEKDDEAGEPGEGRRMTVKVRKMMGGEEGGGMGMGLRGRNFMSEEETLAVIKKHDPAFAKKVGDLKTAAPAKYHMAMQLSGRMLAGNKMEGDASAEKDAVRVLSLEFDVKELSRKIEKATDSEKSAIKDTLKAKVSELFDFRTKGQERRIKSMDADISKLKKKLEDRKANKTKIVEQRVDELIGEGYGW
ncbi:MAG: hypothetical protein A2234_02990 [Elusimicrobia bacterium RIFOXYA2_FULL_58_8]|nr:MAG: hypothetical protein A2234_02990 [Elusimicrobia bacterium RIFOXYA2_FULL_58_8]